jgi:hypothetical protein
MNLGKIKYPLRICVDLLFYATWTCEKTQQLKYSEVRNLMGGFFTNDEITQAEAVLSGVSRDQECVLNAVPAGKGGE